MLYYDKSRRKYRLPSDFKAQFDDGTEMDRRRRNNRAHRLAKKHNRRNHQKPTLKFGPVKTYKLSDKPLNYDVYLKSPYWLKLRQEVLTKRGVCEICGTDRNLNLHHRYYYKHGTSVLYRERQHADVFMVLCYACHMQQHNACSPAVLDVRR